MRLSMFSPLAYSPRQFVNTPENRNALKDGDFVKFYYGASNDRRFWTPMIGRFSKPLKGGFEVYAEDGWHFPEWSRLAVVYTKKVSGSSPTNSALEKTLDKLIEKFTNKQSVAAGLSVHDDKKDSTSDRRLMFMFGEDAFVTLEYSPSQSKLEAFSSDGNTIELEFKKNGDIHSSSLKNLETAIRNLNTEIPA